MEDQTSVSIQAPPQQPAAVPSPVAVTSAPPPAGQAARAPAAPRNPHAAQAAQAALARAAQPQQIQQTQQMLPAAAYGAPPAAAADRRPHVPAVQAPLPPQVLQQAPPPQQPTVASARAARAPVTAQSVARTDSYDGYEEYDYYEEVREPIPIQTLTLAADENRLCFDPQLVYDRAYGAFLGLAVGDALGLQVEGDDPDMIADRHPNGLGYPYKGSFKGYAPNDWTDATDFTVLVMRTLTAYFTSKTDEPASDFALRATTWHKTGFPELGDTCGLSPEGVVVRAMSQQGFAREPTEAARAVKGPKAENGALIRTLACAFTAAPADWARLFCEATHADDRCAASTLMFTSLVNRLSRFPDKAVIDGGAAVDAITAGRDLIRDPARRSDYLKRLTDTKRLADLKLGDREHRSYTLKTLACAMWAFRQVVKTPPSKRDAAFFKTTLATLAKQGGDASANCAVAGAVLGAVLGHKRLPDEWLKALPHHDWLTKEVAAFLAAAAATWEIPPDAEK